ncbi:OmpW/AlkL family protein [Psychrobacter phenylpyruvicus]|uniref:Outer membrane protein W n=1 Tax=Psychrobacter phenylpyruvicus TaxID=29432 RepID=A0A379LNL4_9GAMM|nr:OmpW family outer membrane protein [Psychrobacter phenylpyruvicus]SUD92143.1 outer membrane protein W [Psychrobacter phenylpyruvicus]
MKKTLSIACAVAVPMLFSQSATAAFDYFKTRDDGFKRYSISAGWLHAEPQGKATPVKNTTAIRDGKISENGSVTVGAVKGVIDPAQGEARVQEIKNGLDAAGLLGGEGDDTDLSNIGGLGLNFSGKTTINGLQNFATPGTGLESDTVDTIGMLFTYYVDDHWGVELKAGIPPKVDILGKGEVIAPFQGTVSPSGAAETLVGNFDIKDDIQITDMTRGGGVASTARAWLPAALVQYQFGKPGVNKFRPYVGAGVMYAYFDDIKLNKGIGQDLQIAAGRLELINNDKAGAALGSKEDIRKNKDAGVADMRVKVEADSAWAPIINVGATYDFDENWFAVGSISYAKLDSDTTITVRNKEGDQLIEAKSNIDIDPYITYLGVGYRF